MATLTMIAYYLLFWWLCLFAVLSIGLRTQAEAGEVVPGTPESAPAKARIGRILLLNTLVSAAVFAVWYYVVHVLGMGIREFADFLPQPPSARQ